MQTPAISPDPSEQPACLAPTLPPQRRALRVPTAYQPSGRMGPLAPLCLALGADLAGLLGLVIAALSLLAAIFPFQLLAQLAPAGDLLAMERLAWGPFLMVGASALAALLLGSIALGTQAGHVAASFGRLGKNRSPRAAGTAAVLSSTCALGFLTWSLATFGTHLPSLLMPPVSARPNPILLGATLLLALGVAGRTAYRTGIERVRKEKFCENCRRFMTRSRVAQLGFESGRRLIGALRAQDLDLAARLLAAPPGDRCDIERFSCPQCAQGYVEVTLKRPRDMDNEGQPATLWPRAWLAASVALNAADLTRFEPAANEVFAGSLGWARLSLERQGLDCHTLG